MKRIFFLHSFLFLFYFLNAQDVQFIMSYSSPLYLNPCFAGSEGCLRVAGSYRNQWPTISGSFSSSYVSVDHYVRQFSGGFGISYFNNTVDETSKQNKISGIYSYRLPINRKWVICFAEEASYVRNYNKWNNLKEVISYPDFSAAVLLYSPRYFFGYSVHHLTQPTESIIYNEILPMKYSAHGGANIYFDNEKKFILSPSFLYLEQKDYKVFFINCAAQLNKIATSIGYGSGDKIIASLSLRSNVFRIGYSYDFSISKLGMVTEGSHEIFLSVFLNRKNMPSNFLPFISAVM